MDLKFSNWIVKHSITTKAAEELIKLWKSSESLVPKIVKSSYLKIKKEIYICNDCGFTKNSSRCEKETCLKETGNSYFLLLNVLEQVQRIVTENFDEFVYDDLGYMPNSRFEQIHEKYDACLTLTINTDGVMVFNKGHADAWPFYLTFNELPMKLKYKLSNIVIPAIYIGSTKIKNMEVVNEMCQEIYTLENGIPVQNTTIKIFVIYGIFDKPARAFMLNMQAHNAQFGCPYCLDPQFNKNHKNYYKLIKYPEMRENAGAWASMICAEEENKPNKGYKGYCPIR